MNSSTGVLSGMPTGASAPGNYPITVKVQDGSGCVATRGYTLVLDCPPLTITGTVGNGIQDEAYSATLTAGGGTAPYSWSAVGSLPEGLSIASSGSTTGRHQRHADHGAKRDLRQCVRLMRTAARETSW